MTEYLAGPDGRPVGPDVDALSDPERAAIEACLSLLAANYERIQYFVDRVHQLGRSGRDTVITLIDVDDPTGHGALLADMLVPGHDWQQYRDKGQLPVARGLADKTAFPEILDTLGYRDAASELTGTDDLRVLVLHAQSVQIMEIQAT